MLSTSTFPSSFREDYVIVFAYVGLYFGLYAVIGVQTVYLAHLWQLEEHDVVPSLCSTLLQVSRAEIRNRKRTWKCKKFGRYLLLWCALFRVRTFPTFSPHTHAHLHAHLHAHTEYAVPDEEQGTTLPRPCGWSITSLFPSLHCHLVSAEEEGHIAPPSTA